MGKNIRREREIDGISLSLNNITNILVGGIEDFQLQGFYEKYKPFNSIRVTNDSNENIEIIINDDILKRFIVPANTIISSSSYFIHRFTIINNGIANIGAGDIDIIISQTGKTPDDLVKSIFKRLLF